MDYYAKSPRADGTRETVEQHLMSVAALAGQYGAAFGEMESAYLCGLFHDFGKYSEAFQNVLRGTQTGIDHAICGAVFLNAISTNKLFRPIIEAIAAHHSGLISYGDLKNLLTTILKTPDPVTTFCGKQAALTGMEAYQNAGRLFRSHFPSLALPAQSIGKDLAGKPTASMLYTRMLFSCLVDADYTLSADLPPQDGAELDVPVCLEHLMDYRMRLRASSKSDTNLNSFRDKLFDCCGDAGEQPGGVFTLTAPTGTGKTLSLLHFALRHCRYANKKKIIVVLPFLSLIEQSTQVYRQIIPEVLEDHSLVDLPDQLREHAARWDQPFIVTTSVRFFESLFADRATDCRKLHHLSGSVIIFDESQSLPISLLAPTLETIQELCTHYQCSVVFSTATQPNYRELMKTWSPAYKKTYEKWDAREILPDYPAYYHALRRTSVDWNTDEPIALSDIAHEMAGEKNVCAIVNLRAHARSLYGYLQNESPEESLFLLSTDLCPAHRTEQIRQIRERQGRGLPCRVVATQCIEAGVDLDFDCLYRALAPLEAIIQAAGRCNRNAVIKNASVHIFIPKEEGRLYPDDHYSNGATVVRTMLRQGCVDLSDPECVERYYVALFGTFRGDCGSEKLETAIANRDYRCVSEAYKLIEERGVQVIVPYEQEAVRYRQIRERALSTGLTKSLMHDAAPLTVTCYDRNLVSQIAEPLFFPGEQTNGHQTEGWYVLLSGQEHCYDSKRGLCLPNQQVTQNLIL